MRREWLACLVGGWLCALFSGPCVVANDVLIVADEMPAMEVLARRLKAEENIDSRLVKQGDFPQTLGEPRAVIMYIHGRLLPAVERACVDYANGGGRLIALHHSISSGKRTNEWWFDFLGVRLPEGDPERGGYKWIEPVRYQVVNLSPHFITTNKIEWPEITTYVRRQVGGTPTLLPAFTLRDSEVYLNHSLRGPKTRLLGLKYTDVTGKTWMQDRAAWYQAVEKGWLFYFQPGHSVSDFERTPLTRLVLNAVVWQP